MSMRKFSRVPFQVVGTVVASDGRSFKGQIGNLSMNGLFLLTLEQLPMGEAVEIHISLSGSDPEISVAFSGRVSRIQDDGIGFHFEKVDLDSYTHLKNIIAYNIEDPDKVMDEICSDIESKLATER